MPGNLGNFINSFKDEDQHPGQPQPKMEQQQAVEPKPQQRPAGQQIPVEGQRMQRPAAQASVQGQAVPQQVVTKQVVARQQVQSPQLELTPRQPQQRQVVRKSYVVDDAEPVADESHVNATTKPAEPPKKVLKLNLRGTNAASEPSSASSAIRGTASATITAATARKDAITESDIQNLLRMQGSGATTAEAPRATATAPDSGPASAPSATSSEQRPTRGRGRQPKLTPSQMISEDEINEMFMRSGTGQQFYSKWVLVLKKAMDASVDTLFNKKVTSGRFRFADNGELEILPDMDTYGKSSRELLSMNWKNGQGGNGGR